MGRLAASHTPCYLTHILSETPVEALHFAAASTDHDEGHELDTKVRTRLAMVKSLVFATFDPKRNPKKRDIVVRTDGFIWDDGIGEGVMFEVLEEPPALGLGG